VGDQAPIPIESRVTRDSEAGEADCSVRGAGTSSGRVIREPGSWPRFAAVVAVVGLVAGGLAWALLDGEPTPADNGEPATEPSIPPDDPQAETRRAFAESMLRFEEVHSFSYSGSVRAAPTRPFGAGDSSVGDLYVEGAVLLQPALAREVVADEGGRVVETISSGPTIWTRTAASAEALKNAPWRVRAETGREATDMVDMQVLAHLITTAGNPRGEAADIAGRRVIRATVPIRGDDRGGDVPALPGADVLLSVDHAGNVGHLVVTWPPHDPQLVLDVEISSHNHPRDIQDIAPPDRGPAAIRHTVPVEGLEAEGLRPLELGRLRRRWRLTGAWVDPPVTPSGACSVLNLVYLNPVYGDPDTGFGDYLWLRQTSRRCGLRTGTVIVGDRRPFAIGSLEGSVVESSLGTVGLLFDGTTGLQFETDLPADDAADLLASLRPFDPGAGPQPSAASSD
jgi:hypothetical protein